MQHLNKYVAVVFLFTTVQRQNAVDGKQPIIIDTDVGDFFDDSLAILGALERDDLDVRLIVTASGDTRARASVIAKYLIAANRTDIPIGIGVETHSPKLGNGSMFWWGSDINLDDYVRVHNGTVYVDGVGAMGATLLQSPVRVDIMAIAAATNFPSLLNRFPLVVTKARVLSMSGSYFKGYHGKPGAVVEYNVALCPDCMSRMYSAGWPVVVAPLDVGYPLLMSKQSMKILLASMRPGAAALMQTWVFYCSGVSFAGCSFKPSIEMAGGMYDLGGLFLTLPETDLVIKTVSVEVTSDGYTKIVNDNVRLDRDCEPGHPQNGGLHHSSNGQCVQRDGVASTLSVALNWTDVSLAEKYTSSVMHNISGLP